jgi:TRAP-type C4-dicarboxylate transport system permease small subunit
MRRIVRTLCDLYQKLSVAFLAALCLSVFAQIILRNVFSAGSVVLEELARFSLVSLVFLMIPSLTVNRQQIIVDFVVNRLPAGARKTVEAFAQLLSAASSVFLIFAIALIMERNWSVRTPAMRMPNYLFYLPAALGIALNALAALDRMIGAFAKKEQAK